MSVDNWAICPVCLNTLKKNRDEFIKKRYGKIDVELFIKVKDFFDSRIKHIEEQKEGAHNITNELQDSLDELAFDETDDLARDIDSGTTLREDYELGVEENEKAYVHYNASCEDCGSTWKLEKNGILANGETK